MAFRRLYPSTRIRSPVGSDRVVLRSSCSNACRTSANSSGDTIEDAPSVSASVKEAAFGRAIEGSDVPTIRLAQPFD
jgi:hypothetical protein